MSPGQFASGSNSSCRSNNIPLPTKDNIEAIKMEKYCEPSMDELQQLRVDNNTGLADLDSITPASLNIDIMPDIDCVRAPVAPLPEPKPVVALAAPGPPAVPAAILPPPRFRGQRRHETDAMMRQRLVQSLSASFPGSALLRALHFGSSEAATTEKLTSSCFAELSLDKVKLEEFDSDEQDDDLEVLTGDAGNLPEGGGAAKTWIDITSTHTDDDLTPLNWLQDHDLLKNISGENIKMDISRQEPGHPPNVPYNPLKHIKSKPPYSFSCLIFMAIEDYPMKRLPVKDIYGWMLRQFPYFQNAPTGWKNSVRHNLSLNKCFRKVDRYKGSTTGKGSLWMIDPDYRPNLLQALRKTPYHPFHQLQMMSNANGLPPPTSTLTSKDDNKACDAINNNNSSETNNNKLSSELFPFLSKRLNSEMNVDNREDLDVANTLMEMKNTRASRPTKRSSAKSRRNRSLSPPEFGSALDIGRSKIKKFDRLENQVVPTCAPSTDHTYNSMDCSFTDDDGDEESDNEIDQEEEEEEDEAMLNQSLTSTSSSEDDELSRTCIDGGRTLADIKNHRHRSHHHLANAAPTAKRQFGDSEETAEEIDGISDDNSDQSGGDDHSKQSVVESPSDVKTTDGGRRIRRPKRFYDDLSPPPSRRSRMATKRARKSKMAKAAAADVSGEGNVVAGAAALAIAGKPLGRRRRKQKNPRMVTAQRSPEEEKRLVAEGADALLNLAGITA